mmetsp:Transcript_11860/g.25745  ORF Transcript_11860/g.25745 Transcript_11860/m.25745 type:complete len:96 (-) Transcript_11860:535-822(-)|eukprot:CAMPEP_0206619464 /NCGR_PEP_ID=MMETSP0325_2-20121206/60843_1 /ASSEMBLY_ACC=CAM_ASM_000347 /TAXON_ID=2866 /ORGANISM="Crypthecodinium cohnii, Strain Seligo" /LENGTH=95 /DNA_ID=CAMNT_0054141837 /DNA_START=169 /DNA_END=456 /DNA_ORIENTATION=-
MTMPALSVDAREAVSMDLAKLRDPAAEAPVRGLLFNFVPCVFEGDFGSGIDSPVACFVTKGSSMSIDCKADAQKSPLLDVAPVAPSSLIDVNAED